MTPVVRLAVAVAGAAALAVPATATAAQILTVDPAAPAGCAGGTCGSLGDALAAATAGDTVSVRAGTYREGGLAVPDGVLVQATPGTVTVTGGSAPTALSIGASATVDGLDLGVGAGVTAIAVTGTGAVVDRAAVRRQGTTAASVPLVLARPGSGVVLRRLAVLDGETRTGSFAAPTVLGEAGAAVQLTDSRVLGGPNAATAVELRGGASGPVVGGSVIASPTSAGTALALVSAADDAAAKVVTVRSSVLAAGAQGVGLLAASRAATGGPSTAGALAVTLSRVTIPRAGRSIVVDAAANGAVSLLDGLSGGGTGVGDVAVAATGSIVHGPARVTANVGGLGSAPNRAALVVSDSDTDVVAATNSNGRATTRLNGTRFTPDAQLLLPATAPDGLAGGRLRADAPVIDQGPGGAPAAETDVDGDPRTVGPAPDLGADEFRNRPPSARITRTPVSPRQNREVTFDATTSTDPDGPLGDAIVRYRWDFGDGVTQTTTTPTVTHRYTGMQTYASTVTVTDRGGATGTSGPLSTLVRDGVGPKVVISQPTPDRRLVRFTTVTRTVRGRALAVRTRALLRFAGTTQDTASGAGPVALSLRLTQRFGSGPRPTKKTCRYLDPARGGIVGRSCKRPVYFDTAVAFGVWSFRTGRRTVLAPGRYVMTVRGTDATGNTTFTSRRFSVR